MFLLSWEVYINEKETCLVMASRASHWDKKGDWINWKFPNPNK